MHVLVFELGGPRVPLSNISPGPTKLAIFCGLVMLATLWQTGQAAAGSVTGHISCGGGSVGISIDIDGEIDAATVESVSKLFEEFREQTKKVASGVTCDDSARHQSPPDFSAYGTHFGINSRGGSVAAAMAIGRMFRRDMDRGQRRMFQRVRIYSSWRRGPTDREIGPSRHPQAVFAIDA